MSEFTAITSQEQLDRVIGERIRQVRDNAESAAAAKYSDYDSLKQQNAQFTTQISQLQEQLRDTINGNKETVDGLNAKIHQYETASVKTKVALELGLPYQMASRLTGDDEEAIRTDAEAMVKLIGTRKPVAPLGSNEAVKTNADPNKAAWSSLINSLNNNNQ